MFEDNEQLLEFVDIHYNGSLERNAAWIKDDELAGVRTANLSGYVPVKAVRFVIMQYLAVKEPGRISAADKAAEAFDKKSFSETLENLYHLWLNSGADTKRKGIMMPYCIYGTETQILNLRKQLEDWAKSSRGALGAYVVGAIAMNGKPAALMMVDGIAAKFPHAQIKKAARKAFSAAAAALGVSEEVLSDKIVPNLGFSADGKKTLDFGSRTFTLRLAPSLSVEIIDDKKGKAVKSLPKPGAEDDAFKAEAAKRELSSVKKNLKAVVQMQTARLLKVLMNGRLWESESWKELFIGNPIMNAFAINLIWCVYDGGKLVKSFRYMEDGTFNTVDEEEYFLPEKCSVTLAHPADLTAEELAGWKRQLEDYEIVQPFSQMDARVYELENKDLKNNAVVMFKGSKVTAGILNSIAKKLDMQRGMVGDGGCFGDYYYEDAFLGVGFEIRFDGIFVGIEYSYETDFDDIIFYGLKSTDEFVRYHSEDVIDPRTLPKRFVSGVISAVDSYVNRRA